MILSATVKSVFVTLILLFLDFFHCNFNEHILAGIFFKVTSVKKAGVDKGSFDKFSQEIPSYHT